MTKATKIIEKIRKNRQGQIFLVCTVVIIIYLLSFITIIYELNVTQFTKQAEITEFQAAFDNVKTETNNFMHSLLANYSQVATIIVDNVTAGQLLDQWLDFAAGQILTKGFFAVLAINELVPITLPIELVKANGYLSVRANIAVYMECNYLSIDTELQFNYQYSLSYTNFATSASIQLTMQSPSEMKYIGSAAVTVNAGSCVNLNNGSYLYSSPLVATDVIQATTTNQIILEYIV